MGDAVEKEAQRSKRTSLFVSIHNRVGLGLALFFLLSSSIAIPAIVIASGFQQELSFLPGDESHTSEIRQTQLIEKKDLLYQTSLGDALPPLRNAWGENDIAAAVIGKGELSAQGADYENTAENRLAEERDRMGARGRISGSMLAVLICILAVLIICVLYIATSRRKAQHEGPGNEFPNSPVDMDRQTQQTGSAVELPTEASKLIVVGTLAPGVTHELNNHVNNIALTADLLLEDYSELPDAERLDMVNDIVKESEKAKIVVQNLSSFVGESEAGFQTHDIPGIIDDALRLAEKHIKRSKVKIKGELSPNPLRISCIRWEIEHAFLNIVLNALDAMPGGGTLTISCDIARDGDFVSVEFTDTGSGIPKEIISKIFMPSFTTKPRRRALGLGLAICLHIVKKHGGDIQVKSQVGKGATFIILLPTSESS